MVNSGLFSVLMRSSGTRNDYFTGFDLTKVIDGFLRGRVL